MTVRISHWATAYSHRFLAAGEVQVHRDFAGQRDAQVRQRSAHCGGQQQADHFFGVRPSADLAASKHRCSERAAVGQLAAGGIGHGELAPVAARQADEARGQRRTRFPGQLRGVAAQLLDGLPGGPGGRGRRKRRAEGHRDGVGPAARPLPEELSARETEDAAPHAVQMNRDHGNVQPLDDLLHSALERQQVAGAA